jgi:cystathionine gamma-synthase
VVGGVVIAADQRDADELASWANVTGVTGSPFDAYLTLRGVRTLFARVERQQRYRVASQAEKGAFGEGSNALWVRMTAWA